MPYNNNDGGVFAPTYYSSFKCTADKCRHSCCVDWEICIDGETLEKYRENEDIMKSISESEEGASFALAESGRCPHLNEHGLCDIIISHGEEYLCEICRHHPRFYNNFGIRVEAGLGIVCEEACRIVVENDAPFSLVKLLEGETTDGEEPAFDALNARDGVIRMIEESNDFDSCIYKLRQEYKIGEIHTPDEWRDIFLSLEILDGEWEGTLRKMGDSSPTPSDGALDRYYLRLLTYFVYRHVSIAESDSELRARLAFAMLSVEMIRRIVEHEGAKTKEALIDAARRYSTEIEYSEENTAELIFELELGL